MFRRHPVQDGNNRDACQPGDRDRFGQRPRIDNEAATVKVDQQPLIAGVAIALPDVLDRYPGDLGLRYLDSEPLGATVIQRFEVIGRSGAHGRARDRIAEQRSGDLRCRSTLQHRVHDRPRLGADGQGKGWLRRRRGHRSGPEPVADPHAIHPGLGIGQTDRARTARILVEHASRLRLIGDVVREQGQIDRATADVLQPDARI